MIPQYLSNTPDTPQCPSKSNPYPPKTHIYAGGIGLGPGLGPKVMPPAWIWVSGGQ